MFDNSTTSKKAQTLMKCWILTQGRNKIYHCQRLCEYGNSFMQSGVDVIKRCMFHSLHRDTLVITYLYLLFFAMDTCELGSPFYRHQTHPTPNGLPMLKSFSIFVLFLYPFTIFIGMTPIHLGIRPKGNSFVPRT